MPPPPRLPARLPLRRPIERAVAAVAPVLDRIEEVAFLQSAVVMAAQAFMALFPLLIVAIALAPSSLGQDIANVAQARLGLSGHTGDEVNHLVAYRADLQGTASVFGVIVVLASATSFTRALQRVYETAWRLPRMGLRGSVRGLGWLIGLVAYVVLLGLAIRFTAGSAVAVSVLRLAVQCVAALALWWLTPFILLCGRVRLRPLLLTGVLTGIALIIAGAVSTAIMPGIISSNERKYGTIGAAFAVESWLVVISAVIVACAILGAVAAESENAIGRWTRGHPDPQAWRREATRSRRGATR
jgi:membrane protein